MRLFSIIVAAILITGTAGAAAQPAGKPSKQDIAEARKHFAAAEAAKKRGDWDTAADQYLAAYARFPDPEFYFNIAEVYRRKEDPERALEYYMRYLALDADGRGSSVARIAVAEINRVLERKRAEAEAARKRAEATQRRAAAEANQHQPRGPVGEPTPIPAVEEDDPDPEEEEPSPARPGRNLRIGGLVAGGAGAVALGAALFFGLKAQRIEGEAADWQTFDADRFAEGRAAQRNMFIAAGIGTAAVLAGGAVYYLGHRADRRQHERRLALLPAATPQWLGLAAVGRF